MKPRGVERGADVGDRPGQHQDHDRHQVIAPDPADPGRFSALAQREDAAAPRTIATAVRQPSIEAQSKASGTSRPRRTRCRPHGIRVRRSRLQGVAVGDHSTACRSNHSADERHEQHDQDRQRRVDPAARLVRSTGIQTLRCRNPRAARRPVANSCPAACAPLGPAHRARSPGRWPATSQTERQGQDRVEVVGQRAQEDSVGLGVGSEPPERVADQRHLVADPGRDQRDAGDRGGGRIDDVGQLLARDARNLSVTGRIVLPTSSVLA